MASLKNLDLNLIKVFDAIYASRSVSGAARRMGISQPSVSRGLGRLREHFDDPLFERSGNGVAPTAKAESILGAVKAALDLIEGTNEPPSDFDPATTKRHFRMIMPDPVEAMVMPRLINDLPDGSPVSFEILVYSDMNLHSDLIEGRIDVGVVPFMPQETDLAYRPLFSDSFVLIARRDHPDLTDGFSWPLLDRLRFVAMPQWVHRLSRLDERLRTQGLERIVVYTAHKLSAIPLMVSSTDLVAFWSRQHAHAIRDQWGIDVFEAPGLSAMQQAIYIAYGKAADNDPGIRWLCSRIEAIYGPVRAAP